jgi:P-type Cu+ transporter
MSSGRATEAAACLHCGIAVAEGLSFCCSGCESVHDLLIARGLGHFYELRDRYSMRPALPVASLAAPSGLDALSGSGRARFFLEGIHCLGCLWLLEQLPEIEPRIRSSSLDIAHNILELEADTSAISWTEVATLIGQLGYRARPLAEEDSEALRVADQHRQVARLAVAGFCTGNIMLLAVSLYGGATGWLGHHFSWLSAALAFPTLTYSAWPLYRSALMPLRHGRLSVDLAIALALLAGILTSVGSLLFGEGREIYFDSLSMLVFLLLSSRYFLARFRDSLAREAPYLSFLSTERYQRLHPSPALVAPDALDKGDTLELRAGQTLPVDAVLSTPEAHFDLSLLTGESAPVKFHLGDQVEAGARLLAAQATFTARSDARSGRLGQILEQVRAFQLRRSPSLEFADRLGRWFVVVVLSLATVTWLAFPGLEGFRRALALVIVTCPCVLAFAVPLVLTRALQRAARQGILFRSPEKVETLAGIKTVFLDKTGTLTTGEYSVLRWIQLQGNEAESRAAALALEARSPHPVAKAILRFLSRQSLVALPELSDFQEMHSVGVAGQIAGELWEVKRLEGPTRAGENRVGLFRSGNLLAEIVLGDALRPEAPSTVRELKALGLRLVLLSGDGEETVAAIARTTGIEEWHSRLKPEEKAAIVARAPNSVMVGDGANDSVAFQAASVGVAMQGSVDLSLKNADIALTRPGLQTLLTSLRLAQHTMSLVRSNFRITLSYNVLAGTLAITGLMNPLLAAILMPLSALSVFTLTQWRSRGEAQ